MRSLCPVHTSPAVGRSRAPQASPWPVVDLSGCTLHRSLWCSATGGVGIAVHGNEDSTCKMWVAACRYLLKGVRVSELGSWAYVNITHHLAVFSCSPAESGSSSDVLPCLPQHPTALRSLQPFFLSVTGLSHGGFRKGCSALQSPVAPREPGVTKLRNESTFDPQEARYKFWSLTH